MANRDSTTDSQADARSQTVLSALRDSEERLRLAVEATGMGTYLWDNATGQADYSPEFLALYDLPPDGTLALGPDQVPVAVIEDDRSGVQASMAAGNDPEGDGVFRAEFRIRRPDTSIRWLMARGRTEFEGAQGMRHPSRSAGVIMDITERKRADEALRDSEEQLEKIFNSSTNGICFTEPVHGEILNVNDTWVRDTGISRSNAIGKTALELGIWASVDERDSCLAVLERDGRLHEFEATMMARGVERQFALNAEFVDLRSGRFLLWELRDITERKQAEVALRESEEKFRAAFMTGLDAIYWATLQGGLILDVNPVFETVFGYPRDEAIGRTSLELGLYCEPSDRARMVAELQKNGFVRDLEVKAKRKDGRVITISLSVSKVLKSDQQFIYGVIRDITERKLAEEETAKLTSQLQQAQKMESVGRLAGGVAHDFNNMLGVILGHSELAMEKVDPSDSLHGDLVSIQTAAQRSADLTRQLLAFARKQTVTPKVLNLNDTVAGILKMVRRLLGEDVKLEWRPGAKVWPVKIDPTQIDQILANLCVNSRDAIANVGHITLETGTRVIGADGAGDPTGAVPGDYVWLTVGDDGCGMDSATMSHVFEPFFTTKEVGKGTGLGLATVYGIVKQNDGFIELCSELGKGTVLTIYLPRHVGKGDQALLDAAGGVTQPGQETILLVEDEAPLLQITQRMLEKRGYKVLTANTPGQALQLAREHAGTIHLLITDVVMPEMNGRDLAKNFLSLYPLAKRLFMSGYTADVIAHQGVLDEGVFFIQKPFSATDLVVMVHRVLGGRT